MVGTHLRASMANTKHAFGTITKKLFNEASGILSIHALCSNVVVPTQFEPQYDSNLQTRFLVDLFQITVTASPV